MLSFIFKQIIYEKNIVLLNSKIKKQYENLINLDIGLVELKKY